MSTPTAAPDAPGEANVERIGGIAAIPLTTVCTLNGARTEGVLVAVMPDDLLVLADALAAMTAERDAATRERDRLREAVEAIVERAMPMNGFVGVSPEGRQRYMAVHKVHVDHARSALTAPAPTRDGGWAE